MMTQQQYETVSEAVEAFEDFINETSASVELLGMEYAPAKVLREVDPTAFRVCFLDWLDSEGIDSDDLEGTFPY